MKKKKRCILFILAAVCGWYACSPENRSEKQADHRSFLIDSFFVPIPFTGYDPNYTTVSAKTQAVLYLLEKDSMILHKFDSGLRKFTSSIRLPSPSSRHITFSVHGRDSIYLIEDFRRIIMINDSGKKVQEWEIDDTIPAFGTAYRLWGANGFPLLAYKDNFYVLYAPKIKLNSEEGRKKLFNAQVLLVISRKNGEIINQLLRFPKTYTEHFYDVLCPSYVMNDAGELAVSFGTEDSITVCDPRSGRITAQEMRSSFFIPRPPFAWDGKEEYFAYKQRYAVENTEYLNIYYDTHRKKYYRLCLHKGTYRNNDGTVNERLEPPWSLVVADSSFNREMEVLFPASVYDYRDIQVTPAGVLVSKNNPYNPAYKKNELRYDVFRF